VATNFVTVNDGTGIEVAADVISGLTHQIVKLDIGGTGLNNPVVNSLPVTVSGGITVSSFSSSLAVTQSGSPWTVNVSGAPSSWPLPTGASTAAKQPALGVAGTASSDVLSVQGIASMTPFLSAQSGTWTVQPGNTTNTSPWAVSVSGTPTFNITQLNSVTIAASSGVTSSGTLRVVVASDQTIPISAASLPLPTLASTSTKQSDGTQKTQIVDSAGTAITSSASALDVNIKTSSITSTISGTATVTQGTSPWVNNITQLGSASIATSGGIQGTGTLRVVIATDQQNIPVTGTFWQTTQPISVASLPLPTGASTVAKQPALGTAGTASADVISVQGIASMTPLKSNAMPSCATYSTEGSVSVTATATALTTFSTGAVGASRLGVLCTNIGVADVWISPQSGGHTWVLPAGTDRYIPAANGVTLYGLSQAGSSVIFAMELTY